MSEEGNDNKLNLRYFEAASMADLFGVMQKWQASTRKRLHLDPSSARRGSSVLHRPDKPS